MPPRVKPKKRLNKPLKKKPTKKKKKKKRSGCVACEGTGLSSRGYPCVPCGGKGK